MELLNLLFSVIFITTSISKKSFSMNPDYSDSWNPYYDWLKRTPRDYSIQLNVDIENNIFYGESNMSVPLYTKETGELFLHIRNLDITFPLMINIIVNNITILPKTTNCCLNRDLQQTLCICYDRLSPDNNTLQVAFKGYIDDMSNFTGGFFKSPYINEKGDREWFVATYNRDTGIRGIFPCLDLPYSKSKFKIIVQHHRNYTVLSNMPKSMEDELSNDIVRTHFIETPEIPAYLITIVLCNLPLTIVSKNIILRGKQQFKYDLTFASDVIVNVTHYFQDEWKYSNIFLTEQHFAIPGFVDDGLAKLGFVFYRNEDIIYNETVHPIARKMEVACLIGRKIGREWLSSMSIPLYTQKYSWLHEGIATVLFASDVIDKIIPNSGVSDLFVSQILQESLYLEDQGVMNSLISKDNLMFSDINSIFSFSYYIKAPAILRMLQYIVSDKVFRKGIDRYYNNVLDSFMELPGSLGNFLTAMQYAYDQENLPQRNIAEIMDSWIRQKHYPILQVKRCQNGNCFHIETESTGTWWLPITFIIPMEFPSYSDSSVSHPSLIKLDGINYVQFTFSYEESELEENDWILLNLQRVGYYRVNYTIDNWQEIIRYLNSENYTNIHVLDRAQLIDNVFYFTLTGKLNASIFWELTKYLSRETEYVAWYPMIKAIEHISYIFPFKNESKHIKMFILQQLKPLLETIGYNENPNDSYVVKCLRQEAVKWACILDDIKCKKVALEKLYLHLTEPEIYKLLPGWKEWTYCNGLMIANENLMMMILDIYINQSLLQKSRNAELMACYKYGYFLREPKNTIDEVIFFHNTVARHAKDDIILNNILIYWRLKPKQINTIAAFIDLINHVYSKEQLNKITNFARKKRNIILSKMKFWLSSSGFFNNLLYRIGIITNNEMLKLRTELNAFDKLMSDIQDKINTRLSQIQNQINTFVSVFRI